MKLNLKFEAGMGAGDIFKQIMSGLESRLRAIYTERYTAFAASLQPMDDNEFRGYGLQDAEGRRIGDGRKFTKGERSVAERLMVREEIPRPDGKAAKKALAVICREQSKHQNTHGCLGGYLREDVHGTYGLCPIDRRISADWSALWDQQRKEEYAYSNRKHLPLPEPQMTDAVAALVEDEVRDLIDEFIAKQTFKTNDIIDGRAGSVCGEVFDTVWEAYLYFQLADGARFEMKTAIKNVVSCIGTPFVQFPTTFHNAVDATGKRVWHSESALKEAL